MTENPPDIPDNNPVEKSNKIWKNLLYTFLGTTISIILTFGTGQVLQQRRLAQERELSAMMLMGNVEKFAQKLEQISDELAWRDTVVAYLLAIPEDSIDAPSYSQTLSYLPYSMGFPVLSYDETTETIFANSIEAWKNMGYIKLIDNVGTCFSMMHTITEQYDKFIHEFEGLEAEILKHPEEHPGETPYSKFLHNEMFRTSLSSIHKRVSYYRYLAEVIRYSNATNMKILNVTEEEMIEFVNESRKEIEIDRPYPYQQDFLKPDIKPDSLPDLGTWIKDRRV